MSDREEKAGLIFCLRCFHEFEQKSRREHTEEKEAEEPSGPIPHSATTVDPQESEEDQSVRHGFVQLHRVPWKGVHSIENDSPPVAILL